MLQIPQFDVGKMEVRISKEEFQKILAKKKRQIVYSDHAIQRSKMRKIIDENDTEIKRFESDIEKPSIVVEQDSESPDERKFKLYCRSSTGGFITYIVSIDGDITLITVYRTSKGLQKKLYKYRKQR